jgi:hypothetical protein
MSFKSDLVEFGNWALGPSWKTSIAGYAQLFAVTAYQAYEAFNGKDLNQHDVIAIFLSAGLAVVGRFAKDHGIEVPQSAADEAKDRILDQIDRIKKAAPAEQFKFTPDGADAPIRGVFPITADKMESLCVGQFEPYKLYAAAIVENSFKYGINPLFVLANIANQAVNPEYKNPLGISTDTYPYGESNGHVKNGPRKFSESDWRLAFDRQFSVMASGKAYSSARTIGQWALIDAPPGAENDVHGTNAQEGADVGSLYNKLVKSL